MRSLLQDSVFPSVLLSLCLCAVNSRSVWDKNVLDKFKISIKMASLTYNVPLWTIFSIKIKRSSWWLPVSNYIYMFTVHLFLPHSQQGVKIVTRQALNNTIYCQALFQSHETFGNNSKQSILCLFISVCFHAVCQNISRYYLNHLNSQEQPIYFT